MRFNRQIAPGGYAWWYVDALSDDGAQAITLIAFIGSVFSPYYAWANRKAPAPAEDFCAMNVAIYQKRGGYWAMTERGAGRLSRTESGLRIGKSGLDWDGARLVAEIDEICAPIPRRVRGRVVITPRAVQERVFTLDAGGRHRWQPIAPMARAEVMFEKPEMAWSGEAYFDRNEGDVPLARDFKEWHWSRGGNRILYDVTCRDGSRRDLALEIGPDGQARDFAAPPEEELKRGFWGVRRVTRGDAGTQAEVIKTLEDAPFYARSVVRTVIAGEQLDCVHESLSLTRFENPVVQAMLPFRMPRFK